MKDYNPYLKAAIMEVVENQLRDGTPPETRETLSRLVASGYVPDEARRLIGCVVSNEIFEMLKSQKLFDEVRFVAALKRLPNIVWPEESGPRIDGFDAPPDEDAE